MRILRNHVLSEFTILFLSTIGLLLSVFLLGRGLVQMADLIFNKNVDIFLILQLILFSFPFILTFVIPMSVLMTTLLTFGKLSVDNEIMAIRASGVSLFRVILPLVFIVSLLCMASFILSDQIASTTHYTYRRLLTQIGVESPAAALEEGTFIKKFKNFVIFIYQIDRNQLKGIRIYQPQEGKATRTIVATAGEIISIPERNIIKLRLIHGTSDEPDPKDPTKFYKLNFKTYDLPLNMSGVEQSQDKVLSKKPKDMTSRELRDEIQNLGESGIKATYELSAEIHNKIAMSFSSLAFLLIGIPLGITNRRSEKSVSFGIGLVLMTLYWLLMIGGKALAQKGLVPPFLALQTANFVIGGAGIFMCWRLAKR